MLNVGKWEKYYDLPEIQEIRKKIIETYTNKLVFLEGPHEYYLDGVKYISVSEVTHKYKPIEGEQMAENCVKKWQRDQDPSYKYFGLSKEEILAQWKVKSDQACEFGTDVHAFGESMFYYMTDHSENILDECKDQFDEDGPHPKNPQEAAIVKLWNDIPENIVPVLAETKVFNRNGTQYAGTFDILFYYVAEPNSPKNGLLVLDYKTNKDLFKNYRGQTLLWPFQDMLDQNASYYTLQLSLYEIPLHNLGYKVVGRRLIWVRPDGTYEKINIPSVSERLRDALNIPTAKEIIENGIL